MKGELDQAKETWGLFDEFKAELEELEKEEWITFRRKGFYAFQDFFVKWNENLKGKQKSVVVKFLSE